LGFGAQGLIWQTGHLKEIATMFRCTCLLPALLIMGLAAPAQASPALWEVRDGDSALWFFGSFHILPEGTAWRTPLFDATFAEADKVVFETDIRPQAIAEMGAKAFAQGIYVDGTLLTDVIDAALEEQLRAQMARMNMPVGTVLAMRPWMAANTISVGALTANGFGAQGVEFVLEPELAAERMVFLETGDQQLDVFARAPEDEQIAMLAATLEQMDDMSKVMNKMVGYWVSGTPEGLLKLVEVEMDGFEDAFVERLLYERNRNWMTPLERMLADDEQNLVVVGAGHLVGDGNVLDLLSAAGYSVERIQ
jgi:uncharacterized protein YbaP (TraB family)|tara:strand:+ start:26029 stop:26952 length:924 start_codon:yes stop_codon:yes gene_type:complete